jgi:uroporphyrinogen decarboxylase
MNDRFLRACRSQPVDRTPLWIMRQAGRYLPEYRRLRERADFLAVCRTPELAVEASLQPLRRFPLDAAILFSDILVPVAAMGPAVHFAPGPRLERPVRTRVDVEALHSPPMAEAVPFVGEAVALLRRELDGKVPVLGFCGAPFTLAAYLVEGRGGSGFGEVKRMLFGEPGTLERLVAKLADAMADYLSFQIRSGAQAVQVFDSWAGLLSPEDYRRFALAPARRLIERVERRGAPLLYFAPAAGHVLEEAAGTGAEVLGVCWRTPLAEARRRTQGRVALQGNLDPHALLAPPEVVRERALAVLESAGSAPGHVMNLGHGILPDTPIAAVEALVEAVASAAGRDGAKRAAAASPGTGGPA